MTGAHDDRRRDPLGGRLDPRRELPRQLARTRRLTCGWPRAFRIAPDGRRVAFLRSEADDPRHHLWCLDLPAGRERLVVDARRLGEEERELPAEERARRERARELGSGIVRYATDQAVRIAIFSVGATTYRADLDTGEVTALGLPDGAFDTRPDPTGARVAFVHRRGLWVADRDGAPRLLAGEEDEAISWGLAEYVAAEEMGRDRGFWWSPDGRRLLVCRVDETRVARWWLTDPADPAAPPRPIRYPPAGTDNAQVTLWLVDLDGGRQPVVWPVEEFPYLAAVRWDADGPPLVAVQRRDQRALRILCVDPDRATVAVAAELSDPHWVDLVPGVPRWAGPQLVTVEVVADRHRVCVDGTAVSPPELEVQAVLHADAEAVWYAAHPHPLDVVVYRTELGSGRTEPVSPPVGRHSAVVDGPVVVRTERRLDAPPRVVVRHPGGETEIGVRTETPVLTPEPELLELGPDRLQAALLRPTTPGPWPVLLSPYAGPHAQRVVRDRDAYLVPAWFALHGFAVLVVDGRGTPGRGAAWERAVAGDLAGPVLADQLAALDAAAAIEPRLDLGRVGIRGWSFGGFLAALAVLRRPDRFRAAVAGAPVTDWHLYDTHYTERYLGHPAADPDAYRRSSLVVDGELVEVPPPPEDPPALLLIHGLADDNVVAAHTLRLSAALLAAGWPHEVLPLSGATHLAAGETLTRRLLEVELDFLRRALGVR